MNRIKALREEKEIRAEDLANRLGITVRYLYDLEKGNRRLNEDLINGLCDILKVEADYLLGRNPFPPEELEKRGLTGIDLTEEAEKRGLTPEEVIDILDSFDALMRKHKSKFIEPKGK